MTPTPGARRVIVCGSRHWRDAAALGHALGAVRRPFVLVHGGARGADAMAGEWAEANGIRAEVHPADWSRHGRRAGPIRNAAMLALGADAVVAFRAAGPSPGTDDMIGRARAAGVPVRVVHP